MKPIKLRLRGALGIKCGLGVDEIEIDFTLFTPGLICLAGANGSGKTTILDNMHPYLQLGSRNGSLARHFELRDSLRDFTFSWKGIVYRSLLLIDALAGRTEAYLYEENEALNDGRVNSYRQKVEQIFGPPELFFHSVYVAQGAYGMTILTPAERKELFYRVLHLEQYARYAEVAKDELSQREKSTAGSRVLIEELRRQLEQETDLSAQAESLRLACEELQETIQRTLADRESAHKHNEELFQAVKAQEVLLLQRQALKQRIDDLTRERARSGKEFAAARDRYREAIRGLDQELLFRGPLCAAIVKTEEHVKELDSLEEREKDFRTRQLAFRSLEQEEEHERHQLDQRRLKLQRQSGQLEKEQSVLQEQCHSEKARIEAQCSHLSARRDGLTTRSMLIDEVPCHQHPELVGACQLLADANQAKEELPRVEEQMQRLSQQQGNSPLLVQYEHKIAALGETILSFITEMQQLAVSPKYAQERENLGYDIVEHQNLLQRIAQIETDDPRKLLQELKLNEAITTELKHRVAELRQEDRLQRLSFGDKDRVDYDKLCKMEAEYAVLPPIGTAQEELAQGQHQLSELEAKLSALHTKQLQCSADHSVLQHQLVQLLECRSRMVREEERVLSLTHESRTWEILAKACSKDGIPALELDAAGPAVSAIVNGLLRSSFGNRFQVSFETQRSSRDGTRQLETMEIRVFATEGEKPIEALSGGERVWVERALSEGIAIYLSQNASWCFETSFQDEADGALDPENKQRYLAMLQEAFTLGRRSYTILVSQSPELCEQIGQRISLHPQTENPVELVRC